MFWHVCIFICFTNVPHSSVSLTMTSEAMTRWESENPDLVASVKTKWFTQTLDHFDPTNGRTFQQRYIVNANCWVSGGPIFVLISGEMTGIYPYLSMNTDWVENGRRENALMFQVEHRFYGQTRPIENVSRDNLGFLTVEQTLADVAEFVAAMKEEYAVPSAKVLVFGGSYAGALAAWFRLKYPHLCDGAIASSAPVWTKADFFDAEAMGDSMQRFPGCYDAVHAAFASLPNPDLNLTTTFTLCTPLDASQPSSLTALTSVLINGFFQTTFQYDNQPSGRVGPMCSSLTSGGGGAVERLGRWVRGRLRLFRLPCLDVDVDAAAHALKSTDWASNPGGTGSRQFLWQLCTELGWFFTADSAQEPFGQRLPLDFFLRTYCHGVFGLSEPVTARGTAASLLRFGGRDFGGSRTVFVYGSLDPWTRLGVAASRGPSSWALLINGTSHCQDMGPPLGSDSAALRAARRTIAGYVHVFCHT